MSSAEISRFAGLAPVAARVAELWNSGVSQGQIAVDLNLSRGAVAGHLHRCRVRGLLTRTRADAAGKVTAEARAARPRKAPKRAGKASPAVRDDGPPTQPLHEVFAALERDSAGLRADLPMPLDAAPVDLLEIGPGRCRFPLWDHRGPALCCGAPTASVGSYCAVHRRLSLERGG